MTNREALNLLQELSNNLESVEYDLILDLLKNKIRRIPIPIAKIQINARIDRARKNNGEILFEKIQDLSYVKDEDIIRDYMTEFGRANKPHQPMFYGALETTLIDKQRITAIAETSKLFQDPNGSNIEGELYTISRWTNNKELLVAEVVFSTEAINVNPDVKRAFEKQTEFAKEFGADDLEFYTDFLIFISNEFAREIKSHNDYKISTAYTEIILQHPDLSGIMFPSVQTKYLGANIVFPPKVIDEFFTINVATTQKLYKKSMKILIANQMKCLNPNENPNKLNWIDTEEEYLTKDEYIKGYFE